MRVGSLLWLLRHEVTVRWRELLGETRPATVVLLGLVIFFVAHLLLWQVVAPLKGALTSPLPPVAVLIAGLLLLVLLPFGLTIGINHSVMALFERGDIDLLVSSPIPSPTIFASRLLGVAASVFVTLGVFVVPIATLGLLLGLPQLLGALPLLIAVALLCASLGMLITLALVRLIGPRRARTTSQVLAALGGMVLFLLTQVPALFGDDWNFTERLQIWARYMEPGGPLAPDSLLWLPARTLFLDPVATLFTLLASGLIAWAATVLLHRSFALGLGLVEAPKRRVRRRPQTSVRFSGRRSLALLLLKEWKLILRDPFLISQTLLQLVYLLPLGYILFFSEGTRLSELSLGPIVAAVIVALSGSLTYSLARIAVAGEEASDLLMAAPLPAALVRRAKLLAALLPVWLLDAPLVIGLLVMFPLAGVVSALMIPASTIAVATIRLWNPARANRKDLFRRKAGGDPVLGLLEGVAPFVWALAAYSLAALAPWALIALAAALGLQAGAYLRGRSKGFALGARATSRRAVHPSGAGHAAFQHPDHASHQD